MTCERCNCQRDAIMQSWLPDSNGYLRIMHPMPLSHDDLDGVEKLVALWIRTQRRLAFDAAPDPALWI